MPSYLQDSASAGILKRTSLRANGPPSQSLNQETRMIGGNAAKKIYDSTKQLKERGAGIDDILDGDTGNN